MMRSPASPGLTSHLLLLLLLLLSAGHVLSFDQEIDWPNAKTIYDFEALDLSGNTVSFDKYRGHVVVLYNGATRSCPVSAKNFKSLQQLQQSYGDSQGLRVVAFVVDGMVKPSGSSAESKEYMSSINVTYDVHAKIKADGEEAHPLFKWLAARYPNEKFGGGKVVFDKNGNPVGKLAPNSALQEVEEMVKQYF